MRTERKKLEEERSRTRETEMKTEAERKERDQRHVEFTITLLGCTVIKEPGPRRGRRLRACPVSSPAPLISCVSPTETYRQNLQEGPPFLFFFFFFQRTPPTPPEEESAEPARIVTKPAPLSLNLEEGSLPCAEFFFFF